MIPPDASDEEIGLYVGAGFYFGGSPFGHPPYGIEGVSETAETEMLYGSVQ